MAKKRTKSDKVARKLSKPKDEWSLWQSDLWNKLSDIQQAMNSMEMRLFHVENDISALPDLMTLKGHLEVQCAAVRRLTREKELLMEDRAEEADAIDDHTPPDWPACDHETFRDIASRGADEAIWFCEDCQTIIDEDDIDG